MGIELAAGCIQGPPCLLECGYPKRINGVRQLCRNPVNKRLRYIGSYRITLDCDGSVLSNGSRTTEGAGRGETKEKGGSER